MTSTHTTPAMSLEGLFLTAAYEGALQTVKTIVDMGVNVHILDDMALFSAAKHVKAHTENDPCFRMCLYLRSIGLDINIKGYTPVKEFLQGKYSVSDKTCMLRTYIMLGFNTGLYNKELWFDVATLRLEDEEIYNMLVNAGANPYILGDAFIEHVIKIYYGPMMSWLCDHEFNLVTNGHKALRHAVEADLKVNQGLFLIDLFSKQYYKKGLNNVVRKLYIEYKSHMNKQIIKEWGELIEQLDGATTIY